MKHFKAAIAGHKLNCKTLWNVEPCVTGKVECSYSQLRREETIASILQRKVCGQRCRHPRRNSRLIGRKYRSKGSFCHCLGFHGREARCYGPPPNPFLCQPEACVPRCKKAWMFEGQDTLEGQTYSRGINQELMAQLTQQHFLPSPIIRQQQVAVNRLHITQR